MFRIQHAHPVSNALASLLFCLAGLRFPNALVPSALVLAVAAPVAGWLFCSVLPLPAWSQELLDGESPITAEDREHWSFQPLTRPPLPDPAALDLSVSSWEAHNPIDVFINARLARRGLRPLPGADRHTLIRRVTFDLTGLPPTPVEVQAFLADRSADAYERVVDRLLASPAFGEHLAQFWLDLARFAETDGFEHDKVRADAWRYRDWVIQAFNQDLPYDRFVQLQLAGDELEPIDAGALIATTFCLAGPDMPDINSQEERRHNLLNELTGTVSSVLLGLQLGCAQCHDHKYDPLSQGDFYRLRAIFGPAVRVQRNRSVSVLRELGRLESGDLEASHLMIRGDWRRPGPRVEPAFPRVANLSDQVMASDRKTGAGRGRRSSLARWITDPKHPLTGRVLVNRVWQTHFGEGLCRTPSDFGIMGEEPSHPELLDWLACELASREFHLKELHRLIVHSAVYRRASRPAAGGVSGPAAGGVSRTSTVRSMQDWDTALRVDPANDWLSRYPRRRLRGETLRDAMYAASGSLQRPMGGPGVMPPLPRELLTTLLPKQWETSPRVADHYRRSIYIFARRNLTYPAFDVFDRPAANASCARRDRSTTAPQALWMLNSRQSLDAARRLAAAVLRDCGTATDRVVEQVFLRALARLPRAEELAQAREFLARQRRLLEQERGEAWKGTLPIPLPADRDLRGAAAVTDLCLAVLNSSEFLYLD